MANNLFFEVGALIWRHGVGFGQDGDDIDFIVESLHKFNVQRFETVTRRLDEIQADVNTVIAHRLALHPRFGVQVLFIFGFDVVDDRLPTAIQNRIYKQKKSEHKKPVLNLTGPFFPVEETQQMIKTHAPVAVVYRVTESGRVDYGQCQIDSVLFQKSLALFHLGHINKR
jgi:hypothetical protein